jgi:hypothetical protein
MEFSAAVVALGYIAPSKYASWMGFARAESGVYTADAFAQKWIFMRDFARFLALICLVLYSLPAHALPDDETIRTYTEARELLDVEPGRALEVARKLSPIPNAEDVRFRLLADAALRAGHVVDAIDYLKTLEKLLPADEAFTVALQRAELLAMLGRVKDSDKEASRLLTLRKKLRGRTSERRFLLSRLHRLRHDLAVADNNTTRARQLAKELLIYYPAEVASKRHGLVVSTEELSDSERYRRAQQLMDAWGYHLARVEFERLKDHPKYREESRWNLALIGLRKLRDEPVKIRPFLVEASKAGKKHEDEALYLLARSFMREEKYDDARTILEDYEKRFPRGPESQNIDYYRGWLYYDHRENEASLKGFDEFIDKYGRRSRKSSYVYGFKAWALMRLGRWKDAIDAWEDLVSMGNPLMEGKAYYWQAHAWAELGDKDRAIDRIDRLRKRWPLTYYSMLGEQLRAKLEGKDARASRVWWPEGGGNLDDSPQIDVLKKSFQLSASDAKEWERTKTLSLLNEKHLARDTFGPLEKKLLAQIPESEKDVWVHAAGQLVGDYNEMYSRVWNSITGYPGMIDGSSLRSAMAFPRAYRAIVEDVAKEFGLYPGFIWSIMRQESRYKPGAVSNTDAVGALQMIPATAIKVGLDMGANFNIATFFRPEVGFRFSGFYMKKVNEAFSGLWVPTATAYNSGPAPVARWFRKNPDASFPWLVEEFEYNEGRAYGRKVSEHMLRYLYLYEPSVEVRGQILDKMFPLDRTIDIPDDVGY